MREMMKWNNLFAKMPPLDEDVFLKVVERDKEDYRYEKEMFVIDKLKCVGNSYDWAYGDYNNRENRKYLVVEEWKSIGNEENAENSQIRVETKNWVSNQIEDTVSWYEYKLKTLREDFKELTMGVSALKGMNDCRKEYVRGQIDIMIDVISELKKKYLR